MAEGGRALVRSGRDPLVRLVKGGAEAGRWWTGGWGTKAFTDFSLFQKNAVVVGGLPNITLVIGVGVRVKLNSPHMPL